MQTKSEELEYRIKRIFEELAIRYKKHAPDLINFWIAEEAPHSSALLISLRAKRFAGEGLTNRVTLLIAILKDKKGECPAIFETKHIHISATHSKPGPESKYCFYHYLGEDLGVDEIAPEVREIISAAQKENRNRKKEGQYASENKPKKRRVGLGKWEEIKEERITDYLNRDLNPDDIANKRNPFSTKMYRWASKSEWENIKKGDRAGSFWSTNLGAFGYMTEYKVLLVTKNLEDVGWVGEAKGSYSKIKLPDILEVYVYNPKTSLWEKGDDSNPAPKEHYQSQKYAWLKDKYNI